jgi:hypothetical protein
MMDMTSTAQSVLRLTARDRVLVRVLAEVRYLTVRQIRAACFSSASVSTTSHRLTLLRRRGLLACLTHRAFADRRAFWGLTSLGRTVAGALGHRCAGTPRAAAVDALRMDHLIATNEVLCALCALGRERRLGGLRWHGSQHAGIDLENGRVVPDAVLVVAAPGAGVWMYCLELDRGTMPEAALAAKFERYRLLRRLAELRREDPVWQARASSWILFACPDVGRAALAARLAQERGLERFWSGTAAELPDGLTEAIGPDSAPPPEEAAGLPGGLALPLSEENEG